MLTTPKTIAAGLLAGASVLATPAFAQVLEIFPDTKRHTFNDRATGTAILIKCTKISDAVQCDVRAIGMGANIDFSQTHNYIVGSDGSLKIISTPPQGEWSSYSSGNDYKYALQDQVSASWGADSPLVKFLSTDEPLPIQADLRTVKLDGNTVSSCGAVPVTDNHGFKTCMTFRVSAEWIQNQSSVQLSVTPLAYWNGAVVKGDVQISSRVFNKYDGDYFRGLAAEGQQGQPVFLAPLYQ